MQPYEKQLYQRWEDLEGKLEQKTTDIEKGINAFVEQEQREEEERLKAVAKQLEEEKLKEKKAVIVEEELILPEAARTAESAPPQIVDDVPVNVELVTQEESTNENNEMWIMRRQTESSVKQYAEVKFTVTSRTVEKSEFFLLFHSAQALDFSFYFLGNYVVAYKMLHYISNRFRLSFLNFIQGW